MPSDRSDDRRLGFAAGIEERTVRRIVGALVGLAGLLLVLGLAAVRRAVEQVFDGPEAVVEHAGASAMYLVLFAAVVVAYNGVCGAVRPLFGAFGIEGLYHLGFLLAGLLGLGALVQRLYRCWRPVTDLLTGYATDALGGTRASVSE